MRANKRSVALSERFDQFIDRQIESGRFSNASEVVRAGLRLLEIEEARFEELRAEIAKGDAELEAGLGVEFETVDALTEEIMRRVREN